MYLSIFEHRHSKLLGLDSFSTTTFQVDRKICNFNILILFNKIGLVSLASHSVSTFFIKTVRQNLGAFLAMGVIVSRDFPRLRKLMIIG